MRTNQEELVKLSVLGSVDHPSCKGYRVGYDGKGRVNVGTGGICYTHAIGDNCMKVCGDHVEPGVSLANPDNNENYALEYLACIGNEAKIISGPCRGKKGYVTGTHGGVEHTMVYLEPDVLEEMDGNENFLVKAYGQGLKLLDYPDVKLMNIDPELVKKMDILEEEDGISFPVVTVLPAYLLGSGLGSASMMSGDYDIMTQDFKANEKYGINDLRFGDFVAVQDHASEYGSHYLQGSITIGVVVHSDSFTSGHGPGLCVVATSEKGKIKPRIEKHANLKTYMEKR